MRVRILFVGVALGATLLFAAQLGAFAGGLGFGLLVYTVDLSGTFAKVPTAAGAAFEALDDAFADLGIPSADRAEIRQGFEQGLDAFEEGLDVFPSLFPLPLFEAGIEIHLPLVVIDGIRISAGYMSDGLVRTIAGLAGTSIPSPLVEIEFEEEGLSGSFEGDLTFSSWRVATELTQRLDVFVAAVSFAVGVHLIGGEATPHVEVDVPPELADGVSASLEALHLDGLTWSSFAVHGAVGVEVGPPFLRLHVEVSFVLPISTSSGWWDVRIGEIGGSLGMVIRF